MSDELNRESEVVEQNTQEIPAPEVEETQQPVEAETTAQEEETNDNTAPSNNAFAAQRIKIKELEEENKRLQQASQDSGVDAEYLNSLKQVTSEPSAIKPITPDTDLDQITQVLNQTQSELMRLRNDSREREDMEAYERFPELKSDPLFEQRVAEKRLTLGIMGKTARTVDIAAAVKKEIDYYKQVSGAQVEEETKQRMIQKQQATIEPQTTTSGGRSTSTDDEIRYKARKGDRNAQEQLVKDKLLAGIEFE